MLAYVHIIIKMWVEKVWKCIQMLLVVAYITDIMSNVLFLLILFIIDEQYYLVNSKKNKK